MMNMATLHVAIVLIVTAVVFGGLIRERIAPDILVTGAVALLLALGILSINDVLASLSNNAPFTIACLFILSAALERTGAINALALWLQRIPWRSPTHAILAMMAGVAVVSAFINNTPIVVIMTPIVIQLAASVGTVPTKMLIPLSYAVILGGTCTLIGTSTNLIVDGVARKAGLEPFGMFEITGAGAIMALAGIAYIMLIGRHLLPDRAAPTRQLVDPLLRRFLTSITVKAGSALAGKTPSDAGLSRKLGHDVLDVVRAGTSLDPEHGEPVLQAGDRVVLRTRIDELLGMRERERAASGATGTRVMEGIVGPNSALVGQRVGDLNADRMAETKVIAIHRQSSAPIGDLDQVRLRMGDVLVLEGSGEALKRLFERHHVLSLNEVAARPFRRDKSWIAIAAVTAVIVVSAFEILPIAAISLIAAAVVMLSECLDSEEAYQAIQWPILVLIFGMLALGTAMETTGASKLIVDALFALVGRFGPVAVLSMIYALTSIVTAFMSNNAAGILITPLAIGLAQQMGVDPRPFVVAVMFAASADFSTPIGYQTNTLVYVAGGYRFIDFVKIGVPLNVLCWAIATVVLPWFWPLG